jgi:hypothetical protein
MLRTFVLLTLVIVLSLASAGMAQVTIQSSDWNFGVGTTFTSRNTSAAFDYASFSSGTGGPMQWDFSAFPFGGGSVTQVVDPATSPLSSDFPSANYCFSTGSSWVYFIKNSSEVATLGSVTEYPAQVFTPRKYYQPSILFLFPTTYGTIWSTKNSYTEISTSPGFDSLNISDSIRFDCDAWGTAICGSNSLSCLRLREIHTTFETTWRADTVLSRDTTHFEILQFVGNTSLSGVSLVKTSTPLGDFYSASGDSRFVDRATGVDDGGIASLPESFTLEQNSPNPFNPTTTIRYQLQRPADVHLDIINSLGETLTRQDLGAQSAGEHEFTWTASDGNGAPEPSGVYFYRLTAGDQSAIKKMVLLK